MPQVFMIVGPALQEKFPKETVHTILNVIGQTLIKVVEEAFEIEGKHDVAFTAVPALYVFKEADIQIEIKYTVGEDEYDRGKPFDPPTEQKELLIEKIKKKMKQTFPGYSVSVWIRPQRESLFKHLGE